MSRIFRFSLAVSVLVIAGCGKKTETASPPQPARTASEDNAAAERKAEPQRPAPTPESAPLGQVVPIPGELPIIAKARAYLGTEAKLNSINSIHYSGTLITNDPADPKKQTRAAIEIVLEKPARQKVTITSNTTVETTALNDYEAWTRITAATDSTKWQQTLLGVDGIKRLRANTWENLAFFRGIEHEGGKAVDEGTVAVGEISCEKVAFIHGPNIIFYRYFDRVTGRVVLSETEVGNSIKEQGEMLVDGVRFPKSIITVSKNPAGQSQTVSITFDRITVNEAVPPNYFSVPSLRVR